MFKDALVPLGIRSAQMLMTVAEHPTLSNTKHVSLLPPSWGTLYELTKLPDKALDNAFRDGVITPSGAARPPRGRGGHGGVRRRGRSPLRVLQHHRAAFQIAGGVIFAVISVPTLQNGEKETPVGESVDLSIVPRGILVIAGPGAITTRRTASVPRRRWCRTRAKTCPTPTRP